MNYKLLHNNKIILFDEEKILNLYFGERGSEII